MSKVLIVATSKKTRGGITAVINAYEKGPQWKKYHCHWIQTHRDGPIWIKLLYLVTSWIDYLIHLPFYDIVHVHFSLKNSAKRKLPFVKLAKLFKKRVIVHVHCGTQLEEIWNSDYNYLFTHADISIVLSDSLKKIIISKVKQKIDIRVCYNPCCAIIYKTQYYKTKTILFSGTLYEKKGYKDLLRAFHLISGDFPDWKIIFAGNGEINEGKRLSDELGIIEQVVFCGWIEGEEKDRAFKEASIFCLPSYAEGFPMAVLDAFSYGLPVITTPVGGIPDIAINGKNMLLFNPGDINDLAAQLSRLITNMILRDELSKESYHLAKTTFNINTINHQLKEIYQELS